MKRSNQEKIKKELQMLLGQRVDKIRKTLELTQKQMARILELSNGYYTSIKKGRYSPTFIFYHNMVKKLNVNFDYLFFGKGEIFKDKINPLQDKNNSFTINSQQFGQDTGAIKEMIWYLEHSPMTRNTILGEFKLFLYEKENSIKKDIQKNKKIKQQNKEKKNDKA
jgi:transcriptional regulator with XRE-family HTH domain